jgi:DNA-binding NtrC family response regulator
MARVLVVEDDPRLLKLLSLWLDSEHYETFHAADGPEAIDLAARVHPDAILADIRLPTLDAFAVAARCREGNPRLPIVFITGYPSAEGRLAAVAARIFAYLEKPARKTEVLSAIEGALASATQTTWPFSGPTRPPPGAAMPRGPEPAVFEGMIGASPVMRELSLQIAAIARLDQTVLVLGETGTGKELAAKAIHKLSQRSAGPFVAVNCSAVQDTLLESEFFGHERGAYTDAREARPGKFEQASGGTLFLDEVGDLSLSAQAKLLRAIETREVTRVGGERTRRIDVRLISATNVALESATGQTFRRDLYWRLNSLRMTLPPLRERGTDLELLINHFLPRIAAEIGHADVRLTPEARGVLLAHTWPGNVRELEQVLTQVILRAHGNIEIADLPGYVWGESLGLARADFGLPLGMTLHEAVAAVTTRLEGALIHSALAKHAGNHRQAAEALGIDRVTLFRKLIARRQH